MSNNLRDSTLNSGSVDIIDYELRALAGKTHGDGASNAMRGPRYDHHFVAKALLRLHSFVSPSLQVVNWRSLNPSRFESYSILLSRYVLSI